MQDETTGMSTVLLVKPESLDSLFQVSTFMCAPFEVWEGRDGVDLRWEGRRVEKVYSKIGLGGRWRSVPVPDAARSLLKHGNAKRVETMATPEGELPR